MEKHEQLEIFQNSQEFIVLNAHRYIWIMKHDKKVRSYIEALFLLTYKQEFVLNIRVDGKLDIDNLYWTI